MFLINSRLGLFSVTDSRRFPLSLSYGVILPSSLTTLLPSACGYSPRLPVSVYGTGTMITIAAFLDSMGTSASLLIFARPRFAFESTDLPIDPNFALSPVFPLPGPIPLLCPHSSESLQYWNFYQLSIDYGFRPRLRPRLTLSRSALLRKP